MSYQKESVKGDLLHGAKVAGTTTVALTGRVVRPLIKGVLIKAAVANTVDVYVGHSNVTADSAETTAGYPVSPGESYFIAVEDPTTVYLVASAVTQTVHWSGR